MVILVCGGRDFKGSVDCLSNIEITMLIHGGAKGADVLADAWAKSQGIHTARVDALWTYFGKKAGFERNAAMLLLQPKGCVAFPGGKGTKMMVEMCLHHNIPVWFPYGEQNAN